MSIMTLIKKAMTSFPRQDKAKSLLWARRIWIYGTGFGILYFFVIYMLPLFGVISTPIVPFKGIVEMIFCLIIVFSGVVFGKYEIEQNAFEMSVVGEVLIANVNDKLTGVCCLEIISASGSVLSEDSGLPKYNTSMLLAMRAGMGKSVSLAFEAGVKNGEPYLRIFITTAGVEINAIREILRREATRIEAIFLASLNLVELKILEGDSLRNAASSFIDNLEYDSEDEFRKKNDNVLFLAFRGTPNVKPTLESSQVGIFLSTVLKQNYSASMICVFSASKPGREKQKLEGKWKIIQSKEKRKEESLKDHAEKKKLMVEYEEIQDNVGWFDSSVYFVVKANSKGNISTTHEAIRGLILSTWGGGKDTIKLSTLRISRRVIFRFLTRRHLKKQRMHVSRLASFINTPIKKLPILSPEPMPVFSVPSRESMGTDIEIGNTIFEGRTYLKAGLKIDWLREHVAILGATGTGKTTLVKHIITQVSQKTDIPWLIFDIKGTEYSGLIGHIDDDVLILKPGRDTSFTISLMDSEMRGDETIAYSTFVMLRELLKERGESSELSPAMEKLLRESIIKLSESLEESTSIHNLVNIVSKSAATDRTSQMTKDALLNRLQVLYQEPLGDILSGGPNSINISSLLQRRVVLDLSFVARKGGMMAARLLYNLIAKRIFDHSMMRGVVSGLHHIVVLEEASNLVPESYARQSSADVSTGESMVLLQRATGQCVIVVSTRPNISSNILANTATKIVFRLPYDSQIGAKFLSLTEEQEEYLRSMRCGRALVSIPNAETFEVATRLYADKPPMVITSSSIDLVEMDKVNNVNPKAVVFHSEKAIPKQADRDSSKTQEEEAQTVVFDRVGKFGSHIIAFLASEGLATEQQIRELLFALDNSVMEDDISEAIREFVTTGTIDREPLSLVPGGFVYTLPNHGLEAVRNVILEYISSKLGLEQNTSIVHDSQMNYPDLIIEDKAVVIIPEHLRSSSMEAILNKIRYHMGIMGNEINEMFVVVRGSVAAAKLREILDNDETFNAINVVSAFPSSLDSMIETLDKSASCKDSTDNKQVSEDADDVELLGAIHDIGPATSRAIQIRLWFGLIQDFVDLSNGRVKWETLLDFIETTSLQSLKGRSAPLTSEEGRRALTELLADEVLIALRIDGSNKLIDIDQGLWIINSSILQEVKDYVIGGIKVELEKRYSTVSRNHGYYDLCAGNTSYVIFPNQQQLSTLLNLHSNVACRTCKSTQVVCILTASEYLEDNIVVPENLIVKTMDDNVSTIST
jgi:hypothetical protein